MNTALKVKIPTELVLSKKYQTTARSLRLIAMMMSSQHNIKIIWDAKIKTAATDKKTIWLPPLAYTGNNEDVKMLMGLLNHEIGHCKLTDFNIKPKSETALANRLFNVFEDIYIEKGIGSYYPGTIKTLVDVEKIMIAKDMYGTKNPDCLDAVNALNIAIYSRLRIDVLNNPSQCVFDSAYPQMVKYYGQELTDKIMAIACKCAQAKSTSDTRDITDAVLNLLEESIEKSKEKKKGKPQSGESKSDEAESGEGESGEGEPQSGEGKSESGEDKSDEGKSESGEGEPQSGEDKSDEGKPQSGEDKSDEGKPQSGESKPQSGESKPQSGESKPQSGEGESESGEDKSDEGKSESGEGKSESDEGKSESGEGEPQSGESKPQSSEGESGVDNLTNDQIAAIEKALSAKNEDINDISVDSNAIKVMDANGKVDKSNNSRNNAGSVHTVSVNNGYKHDEWVSAMNASARPLVTSLGGKLEELIESVQEQPEWHSSNGRKFHSGFITSLTKNDFNVFKKREEVEGVNTAVEILVDFSGSMQNRFGCKTRMQSAWEVCFAIANILYKNDVPFKISGFAAVLSHIKDFEDSYKGIRNTEGSSCATMTHEAVLAGSLSLLQRPEEKRILLVITDGVPADMDSTISGLVEATKLGMSVATVLINEEQSERKAMETMIQGTGGTYSVANNPDELSVAVFSAIYKAIQK